VPVVVALVIVALLLLFMWISVGREPGPGPSDVAIAYERAWDELDFGLLYDLSGAELRDGSRYVRQEVTLRAADGGGEVPIREVRLVDLDLAGQGAEVRGEVRGSPIVAGSWFLGFEHPLADVAVANGRAQASLARELPLRPRAPVTYSAVVGAVSPGQLRRDFLTYLERERAQLESPDATEGHRVGLAEAHAAHHLPQRPA